MPKMYEIAKCDVGCSMFRIEVGGWLVAVLPGIYDLADGTISGPADMAYDTICTIVTEAEEDYEIRVTDLDTNNLIYVVDGMLIDGQFESPEDIILDIMHKFIIQK